jgi:hypothetical protein
MVIAAATSITGLYRLVETSFDVFPENLIHRFDFSLYFSSVYTTGRRGVEVGGCDFDFEGDEAGDDDVDRGSWTCPEEGEKDQSVKTSILFFFTL